MGSPSTLLVIADIAGYTRFLRMHAMSVVHAQDIVVQLLEAVIEAVKGDLTLAKLEGDAAFFHAPAPIDDATLSRHVAAIHRAFHARCADLRRNTLCPCDGCRQAGELKIKVVAHVGHVTHQKIARRDELAGVDVILVHRLLKNDVPLPEYLLVTSPLLPRLTATDRETATGLTLQIDELGETSVWYVDLATRAAAPATDAPRLSMTRRFSRHLRMTWRSIPYLIGARRACAGFRNIGGAAD